MGVERADDCFALARACLAAARKCWLTAAATLVVSSACLGCGGRSSSAPLAHRSGDVSDRSPLAAGDQQRIDAIVEHAMASSHTTGFSLAITHRGQLMLARAYGSAGPGSTQALTTGHRLRTASVSKSLT